MGMTATTRKELNKLREITHFLLYDKVCEFCKKPLLTDEEMKWNKHGNAIGPKMVAKLSIHHRDFNHENNDHENKTISHRSCHKSYHRRMSNQQRTLERKVKESENR